jgi:hypothetical protein
VEEWDYRGTSGAVTSPALRRLAPDAGRTNTKYKAYQSRIRFHTPGGLAAAWAPENNREAIFDALARRETYATSSPRIAVRFHAGWGIEEAIANVTDPFQLPKDQSVPMGGVLHTGVENQSSPEFFVWATRDPLDAPLQRLQMVKGWIDDEGQTKEKVVDIACSDGLAVDAVTARCPDNGADVDLNTCGYSQESGASELKTVWLDPDYDPEQHAFYYVRVLMNPTCRWSSYDAIRLGREPDPRVPATIRERAWTSPIWLEPDAGGWPSD